MTGVPTTITVREAVTTDRYRVPIYQRAYAWGADEIEALFTDIRDARNADPDSRYFVGSLVLHADRSRDDDEPVLDIVDGQQRLTTVMLTLAHPAVRRSLGTDADLPAIDPRMIGFEGRQSASRDLQRVALAHDDRELAGLVDDGIRSAAQQIGSAVRRGQFDADDLAYLLDRVSFVRSLLPARTDLNHYFEIMNSRGEQLEKHEIVKARLMEQLDSSADRHVFAAIWDLCSDLGKHVQARAPKKARGILFGEDWSSLAGLDFETIGAALDSAGAPEGARSILALISASEVERSNRADQARGVDDDETPRYGAIIDFPNFLLHVLRLQAADHGGADAEPVSLDDKSLLEQFDRVIGGQGSEAVKRFAVELLQARFLFDNFVIRTDSVRDTTDDDSNWVIHRAHRVGEGAKEKVSPREAFGDSLDHRRVLMLQSMYQVTDSRRAYKEFLSVILGELRRQWTACGAIDALTLIEALEASAAERAGRAVAAGVDTGTAVQHFLFNYLDYLLWRQYVVDGEIAPPHVNPSEFRFQYRKSVEHFYPVQPERDPLPTELVNKFGNLCIMGRDENARRSNLMPTAKIHQYLSSGQSLKFQLMAFEATAAGEWNEAQIERHGRRMLDVIEQGRSVSA